MATRREWSEIKCWRKNHQPRILHPATLSFKREEVKTLSDKQKLREFITANLDYQKCVLKVLQGEAKLHRSETGTYIKKEY